MRTALSALAIVWSAVFGTLAFWALDDRPVQESVSREIIERPDYAQPGQPISLRHTVSRRRDVPTVSVQHFLVDQETGAAFLLRSHGGLQKDTGRNVYVINATWPYQAGPGRYVWRIVAVFDCNPIRNCTETAESDPFEVR